MAKVLITTVPFGNKDQAPLELLERAGVEYLINPHAKKLTESQMIKLASDFDVIIAGTEPITERVIWEAPNLKFISRVGVGLDNVDLIAARRKKILVSYTPDAPAPAVAELTLGLMLVLLRSVPLSNMQMHRGKWQRIFGRRLSNSLVGIIGVGRIGKLVLNYVSKFCPSKILLNDIVPKYKLNQEFNIEWVSKERVYEESDIISLHVPLTDLTKNMIKREQLLSMKPDAIIINTARGGVINENDLYDVMMMGCLSGAAIDVFEQEPYAGKLAEIERCVLTAHMGSMSIDCRARMEIEATEEVIRFLAGQPLRSLVPEVEYEIQGSTLSKSVG